MKPYPAYKDSGVSWLGQLPAHWNATSVKRHYSIRLGRMLQPVQKTPADMLVPYLKAQHVQWSAVRTSNLPDMWASPDEIEQYCVRCGDLLVCEGGEGGRCSIVGEVPDRCIIQNALYRVRGSAVATIEYLKYAMRVISDTGWFDALNNKATIAHFTREKFGALSIPIPPRDEQAAIVQFLDAIDRRIKRLTRIKRRLIQLLNEQKQAIIHDAVTRGLDAEAPCKPSGIDWLGDSPAHWTVAPLRRFAVSRCDGPFGSGLKSAHYVAEGIQVVRLQNIGFAEYRKSDAAYISAEHYATLGDHDVLPGDLLIAGLGDEKIPAGRACVAPSAIVPAMVKADCFRFRLNTNVASPQFLAYQLSATANAASAILSTGATRQRINLSSMSGRAIAIPPLAEQDGIIAYIVNATSSVNAAISRMQREIDLICEYRTRLIADVVTGKIDVRDVDLPELDGSPEWEEGDAESEAVQDELDAEEQSGEMNDGEDERL